ncbi:MAG: TonB family protein [Fibrobacter sp.]|nr:TonB family protein [Fibrobacter sp.]
MDATMAYQNCSGTESEEEGGRILTVQEFMQKLLSRRDIFCNDKDDEISKIEMICLVLSVITGIWISSTELGPAVDPDFIGPAAPVKASQNAQKVIDRPVSRPSVSTTEKTVKRPIKSASSKIVQSGRSAPSGSPSERVARKGLFLALSQQVKGIDAGQGIGKGGFTDQIDAVILGLGGLKQGGSTGSGRKGVQGIGFSGGYGPGGDLAGIEDLIGSEETDVFELKKSESVLKKNFEIELEDESGKIMSSGRSRNSIITVVMQHLPALRHAYNKRLHSKPGLKGRITVRFAIDEFGNVLHCDLVNSTIEDLALEAAILEKIRRWRFDKIDKPGDITEIVFPFVFSAG